MDHSRSNPGAIGRNKPQPGHAFHRAYKACLHCRNKKAKCNITAEDYAAGLPCSKCRREMRQCTFTADRHGPYRPRRGSSVINNEPSEATSERSERPRQDQETHQSHVQPSTQGSETPPATQSHASGVGEHGLADTMMTTIVSNGNDAMNLLFEAAQQDERDGQDDIDPVTNFFRSFVSPTLSVSEDSIPEISEELAEVWNAYRFVRMGWMSAEEAVWYVDMFFKNMAPLSPILDSFYASHDNHYVLITQEPLLSCMIITISSRYHSLPVVGGQSRGYIIHQRLWEHCQNLLMRIVLGMEKGSKAKTRTLGSLEALLLLTEWHPRAMHSPPSSDGWDADVIFIMKDRRDQNGNIADPISKKRWREDVIEPARRSDRMSWMILGIINSLADELGMFDEQSGSSATDLPPYETRLIRRRPCLAKLIYVYQEQLSSRLGRKSMMSHSTVHAISVTEAATTTDGEWSSIMSAWIRLTKIQRSVSDLLFPSAAITNQLIQSGRYSSVIEHVQSLLTTWAKDHLTSSDHPSHTVNLFELMVMHYHSTRTYIYALSLQAIVSRTLAESNTSPSQSTCFNLTSTDLMHVHEVIDSALATLTGAIKLSNTRALRYCPLKVFIHITTASIFLLKALGLGVSQSQLRNALEVLRQIIAALKQSNPDDLHLGARYATLLEMHLAKLQESFIPSIRQPEMALQPPLVGDLGDISTWQMDSTDGSGLELDQGWLSLPLDASLVPYELGDFQGLQCLGDGTLDFLWNLGV